MIHWVIAWLLIALAEDVTLVLVGRALCGFSVGVTSLSLPVYLGETIQTEVRGTLGLMPTAFGNAGKTNNNVYLMIVRDINSTLHIIIPYFSLSYLHIITIIQHKISCYRDFLNIHCYDTFNDTSTQ